MLYEVITDLVSVGSIGPLKPPQPGMRVTVRYLGLPGDPEVSVASYNFV